MPQTIERRAVRALLLTPDREILLIRIASATGKVFWIAPGGGIEPGETAEQALARELREELGLERIEPGPLVWRRHHTFTWAGQRISQHEDYRIVPVTRFPAAMHDPQEAAFTTHVRWWPVADLADAPEPLTPTALARIIEDYLHNGAPDRLPPVEVLVD
jgi:8-oxo-dGTP pyrophosphatase MutT (NUDIX family)